MCKIPVSRWQTDIKYILFVSIQDSPSNKLLFAKDIPRYRKMVERFYKDVQDMAPVPDKDMYAAMTDLSMVSHYC